MSDDHTQFDQDAFQAMMAESMRWATLEVSLQEIADDNKGLVREMARFSREETIPLVSALLTLPEYQSQCIRLEILVALAAAYCRGRKKTNVGDVVRWFSRIGASRCVAGEDPAEDVFVSAVHAEDGTYCMLEGTWEAAGFYTQQLLGLVQTMPDKGDFIRIKKGFLGLLRVSNLVCQRSGLHRYQLGSDKRRSKISPEKLPTKADLIDRVTLSLGDIESLQIDPQDIEPFVLEPDGYDDLPKSAIGSSHLDRRPLVRNGEEGFVVALPTAITVAVRDLIIDFVFENKLVESFDRTLAQQYAKLFFDTPLLGGLTRAPVRWANVAHNRISNFGFEVDSGYYISFHLFQFSVAVHCDGGFKSVLEDSGELTSALQKSIDDAVAGLSKKSGFVRGC